MKKIALWIVTCCFCITAICAADSRGLVFEVDCEELTDAELESYDGRLWILGVRIFPRLQLFNRKQKTADPKREHCDIIAQNRAASLGLDTRDQSGKTQDYNAAKVSTIYSGYPNGRSSSPAPGSSGYYFTSYGNGKEHMGAYTAREGSATYTRYMNRSYAGTERAVTVGTGYVPQGVTSQRFVPLPKLNHNEIYHR